MNPEQPENIPVIREDKRRRDNLTLDQRIAIGRSGGLATSKLPGHMAMIGRKGGSTIARDPQHMAEIGKIGGSAKRQMP